MKKKSLIFLLLEFNALVKIIILFKFKKRMCSINYRGVGYVQINCHASLNRKLIRRVHNNYPIQGFYFYNERLYIQKVCDYILLLIKHMGCIVIIQSGMQFYFKFVIYL